MHEPLTLQVFLKYPAIVLAGFAVTWMSTPVVGRWARRIGMLDVPDTRRIHRHPTPRGGGIAVFLGFHAACAAAFLIPWIRFERTLDLAWWYHFLAASVVILAVGLIDDRRGLKPLLKLAGQTAAAMIVYLSGHTVGRILGYELSWPLDMICTLLWVLALVNAFNLIDGLDGLATGLCLIASLGIGGALLFRHVPGDALLLLGLAGACAAFLKYNFHPASIFLGDSGSMFLGLSLASLALGTGSKGAAMASMGVPLLAVGVPIFDVMLAVWRRTVRPSSRNNGVLSADLEHMHHRLLHAGWSQRGAAVWLYAANTVLVTVGILSLVFRTSAAGIFVLAFVAGSFVLVRHLARVELWDSSMRLLNGLSRPPKKVVVVLVYPVLDVLILSTALALAIALSNPEAALLPWKERWIALSPFWIGIPFIALFLGHTYRRVWSRARITDFAALGWLLALGIAAGFGLTCLGQNPASDGSFRAAILYVGLAFPPIIGIRTFLMFLRDAVSMMDRGPARRDKSARRRILIVGGGHCCTQFLRNRRHTVPFDHDASRIVGIVDDDTNLHGRFVYSCLVLGGLDDLPAILAKTSVDEVLIAADLSPDRRTRLLELAAQRGLTIAEWTMARRVLSPAPAPPPSERRVNPEPGEST